MANPSGDTTRLSADADADAGVLRVVISHPRNIQKQIR